MTGEQTAEASVPTTYRSRPAVVYIAGSGRSGSTLLDRILGQADGVVAVGELAELWRPGELDKLVCGCGAPVRSCPLWSEVAHRAYGGWDSPAFRRAVELRPVVTRHRHLPLHVLPLVAPGFRARAREFGRLVERTYDAIGEVSGARAIVDSSKEVALAYLLAATLGERLRLVHLVRNSNGVAYSWTKSVAKPELGNPDATLARYHPVRMAGRWVSYNVLVDLLRLSRVPSVAVRYEALVAAPADEVRRLLTLAGVGASADRLGFVDDDVVELGPTHTVAGNPMRFRQGSLRLQIDEAWRREMRPRDRLLVTAIASPLLLRFGYLRRLSRTRRPVGPAA